MSRHVVEKLWQKSTELRESNTFMASRKQARSSDPREAMHHSSRLLAENIILRNYPSEEYPGPVILGTQKIAGLLRIQRRLYLTIGRRMNTTC